MRFRTATAARLVSLAALVLAFPGPASAGIDAASYQHVDVIRDYPGPFGGDAGGFISCPAGTKAITSGATTSGLHDQLGAGLTTFDGNGAFVIAHGSSSGRLQISARCVEAAQVQPAMLATNRIRDHRPGYYHTGGASCPPGTVAYGGGGFFSVPDKQQDVAPQASRKSQPVKSTPAGQPAAKARSKSEQKVAGIAIDHSLTPDAFWNGYFSSTRAKPAAVRETIRQLMGRKQYDQAIATIERAMKLPLNEGLAREIFAKRAEYLKKK